MSTPKIPKVTPYTGDPDSTRTYHQYVTDMNNWFKLYDTPSDVKVLLASFTLEGDAKNWYIDVFEKQGGKEDKSWSAFCKLLKNRYIPQDVDTMARRAQLGIRIRHERNRTFQQSFAQFNHEFASNQININDQGRADAVAAYVECIRNSTDWQSEVQHLLNYLTAAISKKKNELPKIMSIASLHAANIIEVTKHTTVHAVVTSGGGVGEKRKYNGEMSSAEAYRAGLCRYCKERSRSNPHRARGPSGEVTCPVLQADIDSGKVKPRPWRPRNNRFNNNGNEASQSNSSGSRSVVMPTPSNSSQ